MELSLFLSFVVSYVSIFLNVVFSDRHQVGQTSGAADH